MQNFIQSWRNKGIEKIEVEQLCGINNSITMLENSVKKSVI